MLHKLCNTSSTRMSLSKTERKFAKALPLIRFYVAFLKFNKILFLQLKEATVPAIKEKKKNFDKQ